MEFDEIVVKETPGLCRCCLSEGCYKDLSTEYTWMEEQEIYADMLLECFDISISQHMEGPNGPNRLICEVCITRLRDACNFKKQVLDSEKKFVDMVGRGEFKAKAIEYVGQMKSEDILELQPVEETEIEYLEDDMDYDDGNRDDPEPTVSEDITVTALPIKGKRGRPKKTIVKSEKKKPKAEDKPKTKIAKGKILNRPQIRALPSKKKMATITKKKELEDENKRHLDIMRKNIIEVVQKSTIMPFRWLSSCFRCFYCYEMFEKPEDLKSHQETHDPEDLEKNMKNYCEPIVHVDVSEISCKLCYANMDDVFQLIDHLIILHEVPFNREIGISLIPMKLVDGPKCFFCAMVLKSFALLVTHMNKFHQNYFKSLCIKCGRQFKGYEDFCRHAKNQTLDEYQEKCSHCGLFLSYAVLRDHMKDVHGRRYKCLSCFEFFTTHYKRSTHMADVHNRRDKIKCPYCNKTFIFKSIMQRHVRENHLKEKNAVCEVCGWKTFGKHELANHMARHTNVRMVKCSGCDKSFKTLRYMKKHYAKNHEQ